jgi:hypothetical protein
MEVGFVIGAITLLAVLGLRIPANHAGRRKAFVWVVGPLAVLALAVNWFVVYLGRGLQENCDPNCVSSEDVHAARAAFVAVAALWSLALVVHLARRRRCRNAPR